MAEPNDDFDTALEAFDAAARDAADAQSAYDAASDALNAAQDEFEDGRSDYEAAQSAYSDARDDAREAGDDLRDTVFTGLTTQGSALAATLAAPSLTTFGALGAAVVGYGVNLADANQEARESREDLFEAMSDLDDAIGTMARKNDDVDAALGDRLLASEDLARADEAMNQALDDMFDALPGAPTEESDHTTAERPPDSDWSVSGQPSAPAGVAGAEPPATAGSAGPRSDGEELGMPSDLPDEPSALDLDPWLAPAADEEPSSYDSYSVRADGDSVGWEASDRWDEPAAGDGMSCPDLGPIEDDVPPQGGYFEDDMFDDDVVGGLWDEDNTEYGLALGDADADVDDAEEDD
jgi:hypothetical protein